MARKSKLFEYESAFSHPVGLENVHNYHTLVSHFSLQRHSKAVSKKWKSLKNFKKPFTQRKSMDCMCIARKFSQFYLTSISTLIKEFLVIC